MRNLLEEIKLDVNFVKSHSLQPKLDFVVAEENGKLVARSIGRFYSAAVVLNAIVSVVVSQVLPLT